MSRALAEIQILELTRINYFYFQIVKIYVLKYLTCIWNITNRHLVRILAYYKV